MQLFDLPYYKAARNYIWMDSDVVITQTFDFFYKELKTALIISGVDTPLIADILGPEDGSAYLEELPQDKLIQVLSLITTSVSDKTIDLAILERLLEEAAEASEYTEDDLI